MKQTIHILACASLLALAACSDDETAGFEVLRSELYFSAAAGKGYVLVSDAGCTATVSEAWCRTEHKGDSILVYTDNNTSIENRTAMLTLSSPSGVQRLPVTQSGAYFRIESAGVEDGTTIHTGDARRVFDLKLTSTFDYTVDVSAPWLTAEQNGAGLMLLAEENATGRPRRAVVNIVNPTMDKKLTIEVMQYELTDLEGTWTAEYETRATAAGSPVETVSETVELSITGNRIRLDGFSDGVSNGQDDGQVGTFALLAEARAEGRFAFVTGTDLGQHTVGNRQFSLSLYGLNDSFGMMITSGLVQQSELSITDAGDLECSFTTDTPQLSGFSILADGRIMRYIRCLKLSRTY